MRPRAMVAVDVLEGEGGSIVVWVEGARIGEDGGLVRHHGVGDRRTIVVLDRKDNDDKTCHFLGSS